MKFDIPKERYKIKVDRVGGESHIKILAVNVPEEGNSTISSQTASIWNKTVMDIIPVLTATIVAAVIMHSRKKK